MIRILAVIPARGGSKGLPGKNLLPLGGKPLIAWTIEQALASQRITDTVVSTDCEQIATVARKYGAQVPFLRPADLATDVAPTEPVMRHALSYMESGRDRYDAVMLLQPTSPVRLPGTIDRAVAQFQAADADSLCGVVETHGFFWQKDPVRATYDPGNRPRRQDIPRHDRRFRENGSLYITKRDVFVERNSRLAGSITLFEMDEREGWEIDSQTDFAVIRALIEEDFTA